MAINFVEDSGNRMKEEDNSEVLVNYVGISEDEKKYLRKWLVLI